MVKIGNQSREGGSVIKAAHLSNQNLSLVRCLQGWLFCVITFEWLCCHGNTCQWLRSRLRSTCPMWKHCLLTSHFSWKCHSSLFVFLLFFLMDMSHFQTAGTHGRLKSDLVPPQVKFTIMGFLICKWYIKCILLIFLRWLASLHFWPSGYVEKCDLQVSPLTWRLSRTFNLCGRFSWMLKHTDL